MKNLIAGFVLLFATMGSTAQNSKLAVPSPVQYKWHEQERIMFIHFGVATWLGTEYDDEGKFDLQRMNPTRLNTDDWCRTAKAWGAKQIIFVAKHVGGFCWWPTQTTDYCVRNIPWKQGKGDLLGDVAASCRKAGLNLGIYIYPGDVKYGAGIGSGGKTANPALQDTYNKIFRQQLTEVLTKYGNIMEVWFDGNCIIDVDDLLEKYARHSVIFQSKRATIRWPGSESGMLAYPAWNTVSADVLKRGVATQYDDDPNGDAWAPLEADVPLYSHNWFWNPANEAKRKLLPELMEIYYKSAGYGGVMLLNCTPDTTGQIPAGDVHTYQALGNEINRRFAKPLASLSAQKGTKLQLQFNKPTRINHVVIEEDYRYGHRIRAYTIEGLVAGKWQTIVSGSSIGRKKIDAFKAMHATALRLSISRCVGTPLIRSFKAYHVRDFTYQPAGADTREWKRCAEWDTRTFKDGKDTLQLNLSKFITKPGQYEVAMVADVAVTGTYIDSASITFDQQNTMQHYLTKKNHSTYYINRTAQIGSNSSSVLTLYMHADNEVFQNRGVFMIRERPHGTGQLMTE